jgi:hypothetical protein
MKREAAAVEISLVSHDVFRRPNFVCFLPNNPIGNGDFGVVSEKPNLVPAVNETARAKKLERAEGATVPKRCEPFLNVPK